MPARRDFSYMPADPETRGPPSWTQHFLSNLEYGLQAACCGGCPNRKSGQYGRHHGTSHCNQRFPFFGPVSNCLPFGTEAAGLDGCSSGRVETCNDTAVYFCCVVNHVRRRKMHYLCSSSVAGAWISLCHMSVTNVFRTHHPRVAASVCMVTTDRCLQFTQWSKQLKS